MDFGKWISFTILIILVSVIWKIKNLILLLLTATVFAMVINLSANKLISVGISKKYATLLSIATFLVIILLSFLIVIPSLLSQFNELLILLPQGLDKLVIQLNDLRSRLSPDVNNPLLDFEVILVQIQPILNDLFTRGFNVVSGFFGALLSGLLLLALTLMLSAEPLAYKNGFIRLFPQFYRPRAETIINVAEAELKEWLADTFFKVIAVTFLTFLTLWILKIPLVSVQALLAGILAFTPYIGATISVIFPVAIALINSWWKPWLILIIYIGIYYVTDRIILPKLRKNRVILVPANVIVAEVVFASFLGLLGLFIAVPLTIISQLLIREILIKDIFDSWQQ